MSLDYAILGFLREQEMSGYDLKTLCFDHDVEHVWSADQAQIYRTLERLEQRRLVSARVQRQHSRPDRKVYALTSRGAEELDRWAATPAPLRPVRDPFLLQLRFAAGLPYDDTLGLLRSRRAELQRRLGHLRERLASERRGESRDAVLHRLTLESSIASVRADIDFIDGALETLTHLMEQERSAASDVQPRLFVPHTVG
ncbi:MAG TPA: PadR family transcriptional regulator [Coriobacteriia bacterium]|nr:PadR family transcriptional regulator [Coriobacteriia bacterium]